MSGLSSDLRQSLLRHLTSTSQLAALESQLLVDLSSSRYLVNGENWAGMVQDYADDKAREVVAKAGSLDDLEREVKMFGMAKLPEEVVERLERRLREIFTSQLQS